MTSKDPPHRWRDSQTRGSTLEVLVGDSGHRMSITTPTDTLTADASIDEVRKQSTLAAWGRSGSPQSAWVFASCASRADL